MKNVYQVTRGVIAVALAFSPLALAHRVNSSVQEQPLQSASNSREHATTDTTARLKLDKISTADSKKTVAQVRDGLIIGGDRAIHPVVVKDIRYSNQAGFERVVIDLQGTQGGDLVAIPRPPYFQVEVNPNQKRIGISIWGNPELRFDSKKVTAAFKKSTLLQPAQLLPKLEDEVWTFSIPLKSDVSVDVFELTKPVRIILDIAKKKG